MQLSSLADGDDDDDGVWKAAIRSQFQRHFMVFYPFGAGASARPGESSQFEMMNLRCSFGSMLPRSVTGFALL